MAEIAIHFKGVCTHLVKGSPHSGAPGDIDLRPVHGRDPQFRVFLPLWDELPQALKDIIPRHYPLLRYKRGTVHELEEWSPVDAPNDFREVSLKHVAICFEQVLENPTVNPPPAIALRDLPSVWKLTEPPRPNLDLDAINHFKRDKAAAYVDFFGGQKLSIVHDPKFPNQVKATFELQDDRQPALLVWMPFDGSTAKTEIRPNATIEISNAAREPAPCCTRDYLLHYCATDLELDKDPKELPMWPIPRPTWLPGTDTPYCSSGTYP
ncbi:MAG TPA: hypothetical protein VI670_21420 [Thermoanaerobaculia bacterium]|jgi:hypothetical protein